MHGDELLVVKKTSSDNNKKKSGLSLKTTLENNHLQVVLNRDLWSKDKCNQELIKPYLLSSASCELILGF